MSAAKRCDNCSAYYGSEAEWLTVVHAGRCDFLGQPKLSGDYCSGACLRAKADELEVWNADNAAKAREYDEQWSAQIMAASMQIQAAST